MRRHQNVEADDPQPKKARIAHRSSPTPSVHQEDEENEAIGNGADSSDPEIDLLNMPIPDRPIPVMTTNPNEARLIITKIVVENFKSYYGKKILGPFHKNYTSILGPNGSGKSNVIDSLLFVFGFRASKIRSKKLTVLIHNSRDHKNVPSCSVSVHFAKIFDRGPNNYEVKAGTEFCISRTVHKAGNSTYKINGTHASTDDVKSTLKNNGIDLDHNRFLILQGEVEQIALMKPKHDERSGEDGMLEYLEDIIGSSRLKKPIQMLKSKLDSYANEMDMVGKRLQLATKEVDDMTEPVKECLKLMRMENKITICKHRLWSLEQLEKSREFDTIQVKYEELLALKREIEDEVDELEKKNTEASERKSRAINKESHCKEKVATLKKRMAEAAFELKNHDTEVLRLEKKVKDKEKELEKQRKKATDIDNLPIVTKARLDELAEVSEQRNREIAECEVELHDLRKEEQKRNMSNRQELADLMPFMTEHNAEEDNANAELEMARDKVKRLEELQSNPQEILRNAEEALKRCESEVDKNDRDMSEFHARIPALKKDVDELDEEVTDLRKREAICVTDVTRMRQELDTKRAHANVTRQKSQVLEALMERSRTGRIPGILGRLGDLGAIDPKYDVAISTSCSALDHVLVESVNSAQQCIEFLKTRNLPRMTFLALDKQAERFGNKAQGDMQTPQNVPRLFDLIEVKNKRFLPAFYFALHDTLVADNIDLANRVSKGQNKRWRVVTLKGELIETSGTLSGGGRSQKRGLMGAQIQAEDQQPEVDLEKLQSDLNMADNKLNDLRRQLQIIVEKHRNGKDELVRLENLLKLCQKKTEEYRRRRQDAGKNVANAKKAAEESSTHDEQIKAGKRDVEKWKKLKEAVCSKASTIRTKKDLLEKRIADVQDEVIGDVKRRLDTLKSELKEAQAEINKENVALKNAESTRKTLEKRIESLKKEIYEAAKLVDKASEQKAKIERIVEKCEGELEQCEEKLRMLKEEVSEATEAFTELTQSIDERRKVISEKDREIHVISRQLADCQDKLNDIKGNLSSLILHNVNINVPTRRVRPVEREQNDDVMAIDAPHTARESSNTENEQNQQMGSDADKNETEADDEDVNAENASGTENEAATNAEAEDSALGENANDDGNAEEEVDDVEVASGVLSTYPAAVIEQFNKEELTEKLGRFIRKREKCKTKVNIALIEEFLEKMERHDAVNTEMSDLRDLADSHKKKHDSLRRMRSEEFLEGFQNICLATQEIYQMITLGGDAALELVDSIDPFKDGVSFQVRPPKKTWKQITNLSGGEKTLASLALVFGLHTYRPTPLYVMDEIDAALDYRNVSIISTYLKERTKNAQFIIISLRNNMFENGDRLLGIYKVNDCTYNIAFDPDDCTDDSD